MAALRHRALQLARRSLAGGVVAAALLVPSSAQALGISLPGTVTLANLAPGQTASASGVGVSITGVLLSWSLSVAPSDGSSPTPGHLRAAGGAACAGSADALASPLRLTTSSTLPTTTIDRSTYDVGSGSVQLAHGLAADVITVAYSQPVGGNEALRVGCLYSMGLTFTVS